ncbi:MAG: right-handed parallel beta-helix repeat-containing protein [Planctomycetota bacterium]|nr:right-handed parallel beta-helix repeat-containing protein [Planctomycetota bacterium]
MRLAAMATVLWMMTGLTAHASDLYVSPSGNDANPGTKDKPLATLERARDAIRQRKKNPLPPGGVSVYLRAGRYNLDKTFTLTPQDSGEAGSPVVYTAPEGETAVITGVRPIAGWKKLDAPPPAANPKAAGKLWVADVPKGWRFHYLYVDGRGEPNARTTPSTRWPTDWPRLASAGPAAPEGRLATFPPGVLENLPGDGQVEMDVITATWWNSLVVLKDIDAARNTARMHGKNTGQNPGNLFAFGGGAFNLRNALTVLDQPGEWVVDSAAGRVYYWPPDGTMTGKTVEAPALYELVRLQGDEEAQGWKQQVHHVEIRGLTFQYTDRLAEDRWPDEWLKRNSENTDATIYLQGARDCLVEGNRILHSGGYALVLDHYAQGNRVVRNEMAWLASGGVQLSGYGPGAVDVNKRNAVERNYVHDSGLEYMHSAAVTLYGSGGNRIRGNCLRRLPYAGVVIVGASFEQANDPSRMDCADCYGNTQSQYQIRWNDVNGHKPFTRASFKGWLHSGDNQVEYNLVSEFMTTMVDGGALYAWCCGDNNLWRKNLIHKTSGQSMAWALYMDDVVDNQIHRDEVIWAPCSAVMQKGSGMQFVNIEHSYPAKPKGYDALLKEIIATVNAEGGWPAALDAATLPR